MFSAIITCLRVANWLNWIAATLLTVFFAVLLSDAGGLRADVFAGFDSSAHETVRDYLYGILALVLPIAVAVHMLLVRLAALVRDAAEGIAFSEINAARLRVMGWSLLAINIADLFYGWMSVRASEGSGEYFGGSFTLTGWIAVPLLFVLAHVFREGAQMREDLEGTI